MVTNELYDLKHIGSNPTSCTFFFLILLFISESSLRFAFCAVCLLFAPKRKSLNNSSHTFVFSCTGRAGIFCLFFRKRRSLKFERRIIAKFIIEVVKVMRHDAEAHFL